MAKERKENILIPTQNDDGSFENDEISLTDLKGRVKVSAEDHEDVPVTWAQHKNLMQGFFTSQSPVLQAIANAPQNIDLFARTTSWDELYIPGKDAQAEQDEETAKLIADGQPIQQTDPMTGAPLTDPMTGMPLPPQPTVPVDPMDNHQIHFSRGQQWKESEEGRRIRKEQPEAYQNAHLHFMQHWQAMQPPPMPVAAPPQQGGQ
jgi:hypothetical protein